MSELALGSTCGRWQPPPGPLSPQPPADVGQILHLALLSHCQYTSHQALLPINLFVSASEAPARRCRPEEGNGLGETPLAAV